MLRVLIACEESGTVRDAFRARGFEAVSCDLMPSARPGPHIVGDVRRHLGDGWDAMIAHPPCTRLCNSGVRWLAERNLWAETEEACQFFNDLMAAPIGFIAAENPIPHKYAVERIGKYDQIIQPWQFGHGETKATCLWLKNLPPLLPTNIVDGRAGRIWKMGPSATRSRDRARTYSGIAAAMAEQWGRAILAGPSTTTKGSDA